MALRKKLVLESLTKKDKKDDKVTRISPEPPIKEMNNPTDKPYALVKEKLSPAGALYGFAAWLTARKKPITISSKNDAAIVADLLDDFIKKQKIDQPEDHWEKDLIPMNESKNRIIGQPVKKAIKNSRKLPKEMKEDILNKVVINGFHGTSYDNGVVYRLKGSPDKGCDLGADKNG